MKPSVFLSTVMGALLALPAVASAQDQIWLKDRRYAEGPGYRVGDFELHPGAALEFGYDSNYFRRPTGCSGTEGSTTCPLGPVLGALRLRLTPSFSFSTLGTQRKEAGGAPPSVTFRGGLSLSYNEFIPIMGTSAERSEVSSQRNLGGSLDLAATIFPGRQWSGVLSASVARQITAGDAGQPSSFNSGNTYNRDVPSASAEIAWAPGAGLFEWRLGYQFTGTLFESLGQLSNLNNTIITRGRWRFLPRTSLVFDGRFGFINYTDPTAGGKTSSHPMRTMIGVNGLVTPSFALLAMVGWGASFYSAPAPNVPSENFDSAIGQVELKWFLTPNPSGDSAATTTTLSSISVGFLRDFYDSYIGTYFERDRGYAAFSYFFGGKFLLVVDGGAAPVIYPSISVQGLTPNPIPGFTDIRLDAGLFGEYRIKDSFGINATVRYNQNINHQLITISSLGATDSSFSEVEAYIGARWLM